MLWERAPDLPTGASNIYKNMKPATRLHIKMESFEHRLPMDVIPASSAVDGRRRLWLSSVSVAIPHLITSASILTTSLLGPLLVSTCPANSGDHREVVSHIFGRNKACTRDLANDLWIYWCRKHYQRLKYRAEDSEGWK